MDFIEENVKRFGWHIVNEDIYFSRQQAMFEGAAGRIYAGTVLGKASTGTATAVADVGNTGDGTFSAVELGSDAKDGEYTVEFTAATKFKVTDPAGTELKPGTVGQAYKNDIEFTATAGGTAFVVGDKFVVAVALAAGTYGALDLTDTNGLQVASAVLLDNYTIVDSVPKRVVVNCRKTEVAAEALTWPDGITDAQKTAAIHQLEAREIILR